MPTARWCQAGSRLREVRPLRRVATQLEGVVFDSVAAEPRRDHRPKPNRPGRSRPHGVAQDLSDFFFSGAPMGSGPTLERVLHVLIELTDQELCHAAMIACYHSSRWGCVVPFSMRPMVDEATPAIAANCGRVNLTWRAYLAVDGPTVREARAAPRLREEGKEGRARLSTARVPASSPGCAEPRSAPVRAPRLEERPT